MKGSVKETKVRSNDDIVEDPRYICKSCTLITEALQRGGDVMQLPNGDIIITELKTVTSHYNWDSVKEKMVKFSTKIVSELK
jgi:hypothetical protein